MKKIQVQIEKNLEVLRKKQSPQHLSSQKASKVLRTHSRKHPPPENLAWLIEMVNLLPSDVQFDYTSREAAELTENRNENFHLWMIYAFERLPKKVREYVGAYPIGKNDPQTEPVLKAAVGNLICPHPSVQEYDLLVIGKKLLRSIANWSLPNGGDTAPFLTVELTLDDDYQVAVKPSRLIECLAGADVRRIRECPLQQCAKIFWAERMDQPTCSKRCNRIRRSRIQRGTYQPSQIEIYRAHRKDSPIHKLIPEEEEE